MKIEKDFWKGRYGFDSLSIFLILLCMIFNLLTLLHPSGSFLYLGVIGYLFLLLVILRGVSRNHRKRQKEDRAFLELLAPLTRGIDERSMERDQRKVFKFFNCPACRQRIRVPRGKGKIEITCPNCATRFIKKT